MQPYLLQTFFFLAVTSLAFVCIPKSFCQDENYVSCGESFRCGNLNFSYPFWGGNRPRSCGYPGFGLTCESNVALLAFQSLRYRILAIDGSQQGLTVARDDLWDSLCPRSIYNTTFDYSIIRYSSGLQNVTFSYGCTIHVPDFPRQPNQFNCSVNTTTNTTNFYSTNTLGINRTAVACSSTITVPVNQIRTSINLGNSAALLASLKEGFDIKWAANDSVCDGCTQSGGRCGFNLSTDSFLCYCPDHTYDLKCSGPKFRRSNDPPDLPLFASGISFGTIAWMLSIAGLSYLIKRCLGRKGMIRLLLEEEDNEDVQVFLRNYGSLAPKYYSFTEIKVMTNSFAHKLGQGGYGFVYKGKLSDGRQVAVKVLRDNKGNGEDFINEVASISRTSHVNVVTLLGFCYEANRRALVYDFMPNGSLDKFICSKESRGADCRLEWEVLFQIAVGTARGLEYLHQGCNTRIVHFDIKPHNILLDEDFCPKISDFGLAKLCKKKESILSRMDARGTVGYIAPEVVFRGVGGVSHKSDVYSYGMMVLEMVGLKSRIQVHTDVSGETYFPNWIYERLELDMDLGLEGVMNVEDEEAAMKMILVGLWCIQTRPSDRPSMSKVVEMLESSLQSLQIPPKPYLLESPADVRSIQESSALAQKRNSSL